MSRNRMKNSQSLHWMGVVKWILIASLISGLGLVYMFCKNKNMHLAAETHQMELQLTAIEARNKELNGNLESMKSMKKLVKRLGDMHSDLVYWNDPRANWVTLEQNPHARLYPMGTSPRGGVNLDSAVVNVTTPVGH